MNKKTYKKKNQDFILLISVVGRNDNILVSWPCLTSASFILASPFIFWTFNFCICLCHRAPRNHRKDHLWTWVRKVIQTLKMLAFNFKFKNKIPQQIFSDFLRYSAQATIHLNKQKSWIHLQWFLLTLSQRPRAL